MRWHSLLCDMRRGAQDLAYSRIFNQMQKDIILRDGTAAMGCLLNLLIVNEDLLRNEPQQSSFAEKRSARSGSGRLESVG